MGIIPPDALLVFAGGPWWGGIIILALMLPGRLLGRLIYVTCTRLQCAQGTDILKLPFALR